MHLTKKGTKDLEGIVELLNSKHKLNLRVEVVNANLDAPIGHDSAYLGGFDMKIKLLSRVRIREAHPNQDWLPDETAEYTVASISFSELPSCGIAVVSDLYYINPKRHVSPFNVNMTDYTIIKNISKSFLWYIIERINTDDNTLSKHMRSGRFYNCRYGRAKTLMFTGLGDHAGLYEDMGFVKVAPYNNTRYMENTRFIYLLESRKEPNEKLRKYGNYPENAIANPKVPRFIKPKINIREEVTKHFGNKVSREKPVNTDELWA